MSNSVIPWNSTPNNINNSAVISAPKFTNRRNVHSYHMSFIKNIPRFNNSTAAFILGWWAENSSTFLNLNNQNWWKTRTKQNLKISSNETFAIRNIHNIMSSLLIESNHRAYGRATNRQFCTASPSPLKTHQCTQKKKKKNQKC